MDEGGDIIKFWDLDGLSIIYMIYEVFYFFQLLKIGYIFFCSMGVNILNLQGRRGYFY